MSQLSEEQIAKLKKHYFADAYGRGKIGTIEGGDGTPVVLNTIGHSKLCIASRAAEYGCKPGEEAILAE
jgi:hypothetical protein